MEPLQREVFNHLVRAALAEDVGTGDATTLATVPEDAAATAHMVAREPMTACGMGIASAVFEEVDATTRIQAHVRDGARCDAGTCLLTIRGRARAILTAERTALNFAQRLSGVATMTSAYVALVAGTGARILDTRKTTPGWRLLEKYAVACGGGTNHRFGLFDLILIKDNHLAALRDAKPNAIEAAVKRARSLHPELRVEVEADTLEQVSQALSAGADIILLDNMSLDQLREAVAMNRSRARLEASGGVNLSTVRSIAETGVDFISVGAVTHSARSMDIALDFAPGRGPSIPD